MAGQRNPETESTNPNQSGKGLSRIRRCTVCGSPHAHVSEGNEPQTTNREQTTGKMRRHACGTWERELWMGQSDWRREECCTVISLSSAYRHIMIRRQRKLKIADDEHKMRSLLTRDDRNGERRSTEWREWLQSRIQGLPWRLGGRVPELPVGARVLVLRGEIGYDLGQMAIVNRLAGSQVEISFRGPNGELKTKRKQPVSLLRMSDEVEVCIGDGGWPMLQRTRENEDEERDRVGAVVSESESVAQ